MRHLIETARLTLSPLDLNDNEFIFRLVNTPGWIEFIGNRNIANEEQAITYIGKILSNPAIKYWVVRTMHNEMPVGIITLIQRDYLDHPDIGFAFLPEHAKHGYAFEAASVILKEVLDSTTHEYILATTKKDNITSIRLLQKLGLMYAREISVGNEKLDLYSMKVSVLNS